MVSEHKDKFHLKQKIGLQKIAVFLENSIKLLKYEIPNTKPDTMLLFPIAFKLGCSNVTNDTLLKTLGPWGGLYVASSLIQVYMYSYIVAKKRGLFGVRQLMKQAVPFPRIFPENTF